MNDREEQGTTNAEHQDPGARDVHQGPQENIVTES